MNPHFNLQSEHMYRKIIWFDTFFKRHEAGGCSSHLLRSDLKYVATQKNRNTASRFSKSQDFFS